MYIDSTNKRKPIGVLMIEHRLIERALDQLEERIKTREGPHDVIGLQELIDFFGTYADATHHGKEEDIMFEVADKLNLGDEANHILEELRKEHIEFRGHRQKMDKANRKLAVGDVSVIDDYFKMAGEFIELLRRHIKKEDKIFFPAFDSKQSEDDRYDMKEKFREFDAEQIHKAYALRIEGLEINTEKVEWP